MKPQFTPEDVEIISKEPIFQGFFRMLKYTFRHKLFSGGWSEAYDREMFERGRAAALLPYDPVRDEVVLTEQIRVGALEDESPWQIEIVAGIMDKDEDPEELARREAVEEAGVEVGSIVPVTSYYPSAGGCNERLDVFVGQVGTSNVGGVHGLECENEDIRVQVVSREEAYNL